MLAFLCHATSPRVVFSCSTGDLPPIQPFRGEWAEEPVIEKGVQHPDNHSLGYVTSDP